MLQNGQKYTWVNVKRNKNSQLTYVAGYWTDNNGNAWSSDVLTNLGWVLTENQQDEK